jgi:hypothetical protein
MVHTLGSGEGYPMKSTTMCNGSSAVGPEILSFVLVSDLSERSDYRNLKVTSRLFVPFASCSPCPEPSPCRPLSSLSYSTPPSLPSSDVPRSTHLTTCGDEPFQLRRRRPQGISLSSFSDPSTSTPTFLTTSCTITLGRSTSCPDPLSCSNVLVSRSLSRTQARPIVPYFLYHF